MTDTVYLHLDHHPHLISDRRYFECNAHLEVGSITGQETRYPVEPLPEIPSRASEAETDVLGETEAATGHEQDPFGVGEVAAERRRFANTVESGESADTAGCLGPLHLIPLIGNPAVHDVAVPACLRATWL
jgi:hypothetical protein